MIYVKEWNNRYNCTAIKKNAFHLTKVTDDVEKNTNKKGGGPNLEGSASQMGMKKLSCLCVCWTVHYMLISSVPVKPDS